MKYNPSLHTKSLLIKGLLGKAESFVSNISKNRNDVIILNYHGTQKPFLENFEWQIEFLLKHFDPITPMEFEKIIETSQKLKIKKPKFLLTFDDGILNNLNIINLLKKHSLEAYFFIIPEFVDAIKPKTFFIENIRPIINPKIDNNKEDFTPLAWADIAELIKHGHTIGAHTSSHMMTKETCGERLEYEIVKAKQILEDKLNILIKTFCSINNTLESVNSKAALKIKENYQFHFTTIAGKNIPFLPFSIKRTNVESHWNNNAFKYAIGKWEQKRWKNKVLEVNQLMK
jgi:peptidoglycan/xylan/chitin deacetylase (PgdA/CDA1 family)